MAQIKLTKSELRSQQYKCDQLQKYLPTLQLKKALLQIEVNHALNEIEEMKKRFTIQVDIVKGFKSLLGEKHLTEFFDALHIIEVETHIENIAGVEIPFYEKVHFTPSTYTLFETPFWWDDALNTMRKLIEIEQELVLLKKRKELLHAELRAVSIRVNLFEKILIPRTLENIKKIKIFLGDQQLSAVSQAKVAKKKIELRKEVEL